MKILRNKTSIDSYDIFLIGIIVSYYVAKLHINGHIWGLDIGDMVDLRPNTALTAAFHSANLPVNYLLTFLYKTLGLSSEFIKAMIALFGIATITICIYKISLSIFENKKSAILAVILFLFSSLYFSVSAAKPIEENNLTTLSFSFLILGILYWLKDRYVLASLFIGLSFDCHPIYPIALIVVFFTYSLIRYKRVTLKTVVLSLFVFLITTFPVTFSVVKSALFTVKGSTSGTLDPELIWRYIRVAQPEMAFVDIRPEFHIGFSIYFASFLLLSLFYVYGEKTQREIFIKLFLLMLTTISFGIFDNLNSYHFKIIPLMNLWLNRFTSYGSIMAYVILAGAVTSTICSTNFNKILQTCIFLLLCFSVLCRPLWLIHFLILEAVIIYFIYNFIHIRRELSYKALTFNKGLLSAALIYFYYLAICHEHPTGIPFANLFSLDSEALFFQAFFYSQFIETYIYLKESITRHFLIILAVSEFFFFFVLLRDIDILVEKGVLLSNKLATAAGGVIPSSRYTNAFTEKWAAFPNKLAVVGGAIIMLLIMGIWAISNISNVSKISKDTDRPDIWLLPSTTYAVWNMDTAAGDVIADSKGGHNATSFNVKTARGFSGKARYFNGRDSYISTPVNFQGWKGFTISLWVKPERKGGEELSVILDNGHSAESNFVIQSADAGNSGSGRWAFHCNGANIPLPIPFDQWTHLVVVADVEKGIIKAYTDNVKVGETKTVKGSRLGTTPLSIGKLTKSDERYFKGIIDEVMILDKAH